MITKYKSPSRTSGVQRKKQISPRRPASSPAIKKKTVYSSPDVTVKYCYDGDQVIAEYDVNDNLLRKFIYGPGIDESVCMIDVAGNNIEKGKR